MAVMVGSARSSFGNTSPGDQAGGKEISTQAWYLHSKGWYVYRAKDPAVREKIALAMEKACANNDIGYSQPTRNSLYNDIKGKGFDPSKTSKKVNTDCSALVRVCCAYAGIMLGDFITSSEGATLMKSGQFDRLSEDKYCKRADYLMRGDILCTRTKGHTVVVLTDGRKAEYPAITPEQPDASNSAMLVVTGDTVNLRSGPGTQHDVVLVARKGDRLAQADTAGWSPVLVDGAVLWISDKYTKKG